MNVIQWDQKQITVPGLYAGVPLDDYHKGTICDAPSISSSGLRTIFSESPADYFAKSPYNPEYKPEEDDEKEKEAFVIGRATHHLFLGQREFSAEYVMRPETVLGEKWNSNANICKKWLRDHVKGRTVLTPKQGEMIFRMAKALAKEPLVRAGILHGKREHSFFWRDPVTGYWLKARPDAVPNDSADFSDYKTTVSVHDEDCMRAIGERAYHMQGALIGMGARAVLGVEMNTFNLVFQQKKAPHCVNVVEVKQDALKRGVEECGLALRLFEKCMKSGDWPGPAGRRDASTKLGLRGYDEKDRDYRASVIKKELTA